MCGICGNVGSNPSVSIERMNDRMASRGPDDQGVWRNGSVALGHRRLAVIGLSRDGHQPMRSSSGDTVITYNGEIYNYAELRAELILKGHVFATETDTEVILRLYEEYGEDCLSRLRGMFAFGIWDEKRSLFFAARDPLGIKPFFYHLAGDSLVFASTVEAVLASGAVLKRIDPDALAGYLQFGSVPAPRTLIQGVVHLPPGHCLKFENGRLTTWSYWKPDFSKIEKNLKMEDQFAREVRAAVEDAVKTQLVSDVPLGVFLSGGIDSGAVAALAQQFSRTPIKTFSVVFEESEYDEGAYAEQTAAFCKTEHASVLVDKRSVLREMPSIFAAMDQPSIDGFNTYVISQAAKKAGLTVALSGLGADELFAGYPMFRTLPRMEAAARLLRRLPRRFRSSIGRFFTARSASRKSIKFFRMLFGSDSLDDLHGLQRSVFFPEEVDRITAVPVARERKSECGPASSDPVNRLSCLELRGYVQNTLLPDADRMSMAHSLEVRVPFLDRHLVEKMASIPGGAKAGRGRPKKLLIRAMRELLPPDVFRRKKRGFVLPFDQWLRTDLRDYCETAFSRENLRGITCLNAGEARKIWEDFAAGSKRYNASSVLLFLSLIQWHKRNMS